MPIAKQTARRILADAGAERISDKAAETLADMLNSFAYSVAKKAVKLAKHAKRKTVSDADVKLAR